MRRAVALWLAAPPVAVALPAAVARVVAVALLAAAALPVVLAAAAAMAAEPAAPQTDDAIAAALLGAQYGSARRDGCYVQRTADLGSFCMKAIHHQRVDVPGGARLYVLADGWPMNAKGEVEDIGTHASPGLVGAFELALGGSGTGPSRHLIAASKALRFGSFGRSNADGARFTRIGPGDDFAWIFVSGGTWQGISVGSHVILAAHGGRFVNVSDIPAITEQEQGERLDIAVDASSGDRPLYPLIVTRQPVNDRGQPVGAPDRTWTVHFNNRLWKYPWPPGQNR